MIGLTLRCLRQLAIQQSLGRTFLGGLSGAILMRAAHLRQHQAHHLFHIARVAPEEPEDLREDDALFRAADQNRLQRMEEILAPGETGGLNGADSLQRAAGSEGETCLAQGADEMGDILGKAREHGINLRAVGTGEAAAIGMSCDETTTPALVARDAATKSQFADAAREETDHLAWTAQRLRELGSRPSLVNPLWYAGSFAIGIAAGLAGERRNLGFAVETERQVEEHLDGHLDTLPAADAKSRAIVETMRGDDGPNLLKLLDRCATSAGGRMLRRWLLEPLRSQQQAARRHACVETLLGGTPTPLYESLLADLRELPDLERIASRIALRSVRPRELAALRDAAPAIARIAARLDALDPELFGALQAAIQVTAQLHNVSLLNYLPQS